MAEYMMLLLSDENAEIGAPPQSLFEAIGELGAKWGAEGVLKHTGGLIPTSAATQVRNAGGTIAEVSGPFNVGGEAVTGYAIVDVDSREEAVARAREFVELHQTHWPAWRGASEVRASFGA